MIYRFMMMFFSMYERQTHYGRAVYERQTGGVCPGIEHAVLTLAQACGVDDGQIVKRIKAAGKLAFVHADLIEGLSNRGEIAVDFLAEATKADGIISTRPNLIHHAKELGLITVQRFFLLDSISFENVVRQSSHADVIDILPGAMPDVIRRLSQRVTQPLIASGLLTDKRDVCGALAAGAVAVSTTSEELWEA